MPSNVRICLVLAFAAIALPSEQGSAMALSADLAQDVPLGALAGEGPRGTSGDVREDVVGYTSPLSGSVDARFGAVAIGVAHPSIPPGGFVELTSLDTGHTIVAMVVARSGPGGVVALSAGAARALGVSDRAAVRVRATVVSVQDQVALRSGQIASPRLDAPPVLLTALRHKLPVQQGREIPPPTVRSPIIRQAPPTTPRMTIRAGGGSGFVLQVAALSSPQRAAALAKELGGHVAPAAKLYRVQLGPFADVQSARRARDDVAHKGYPDAILHAE